MEEDRNDSGINSGSDFHSSSPGSENSQDFNNAPYAPQTTTNSTPYYSTPMFARPPYSSHVAYNTASPHLGFNPLTPPNSEPMASPNNTQSGRNDVKSEYDAGSNDVTLTPRSSPNNTSVNADTSVDGGAHEDDPIRRLQISLEKSGLYGPAESPKPSENSLDDDGSKSDGEPEEFDEEGLRNPRMNSHGKVKTFKCKQCDYVSVTKVDFWDHSRCHIKADKLLTCPKCPFVTEYKHHLEYHLRNHFGSKPFKCDKCNYSCVNKSMLNSHMKSHSNIYQYRCSDCSYATKYCHSLKLHLRKYSHKPAMVLNPDGTPNPLPIIDVYGTRRGPKQKSNKPEDQEPLNPHQAMLQHPLAQLMLKTQSQMQLPFPYPFLGGFPNPLLFPQALGQFVKERNEAPSSPEAEKTEETPTDSGAALDLSKPEPGVKELGKSRRKGRAYKLGTPVKSCSSSEEDEDTPETKMEVQKAVCEEKEEEVTNNNNKLCDYSCQYCSIAFGDIVLYTMHMGYHGYKDPFTCNMCGEQCNDKVSFFLHIARTPHS